VVERRQHADVGTAGAFSRLSNSFGRQTSTELTEGLAVSVTDVKPSKCDGVDLLGRTDLLDREGCCMEPQRVLITNDDGIAAPGIRRLACAALDYGFDVVVAVPTEESSGVSAAMTAVLEDGRVAVDRREVPTLEEQR
jgi:Survival protein SurE